jgi:hypothetical protein
VEVTWGPACAAGHEMNSKMIKSRMVVLTGREKGDGADANVVVGWMLQPTAGALVGERERKLMWRGW